MTTRIRLGCDPELFAKLGDDYIPAAGLIPGDKKNPFPVERGSIQVDGCALEIGIDPVESIEDWDKNISVVLTQLEEELKKNDRDFTLSFVPCVEFDKKLFDKVPEQNKQLGCDPDYSITGAMKIPPKINSTLRTGSGHIHIGWTEDAKGSDPVHFEDCRFVAEKFYNSRMFNPGTEVERMRLKYYGSDGAFRPKSYGVELRSPSNIWVKSKEGRFRTFGKVMTKMQELVV
jgi:hypothetical protein